MLCKFLLLSLLIVPALPMVAQDEDSEPTGPWLPMKKPDKTDVTSLKLIDLHLKARGGRIELENVRTITCEGELIEGQKDYVLQVSYGAPGKIRVTTDRFFRGWNYVTTKAYDGKIAWSQDTSPDVRSPRPVTGLNRQLLELDAMLPFLLLHADQHGTVFTYTGEDTFADHKVYVMHGWLRNGLEIEVLLDAKSFQVLNYRQPYDIGGKVIVVDRMPIGLTRVLDTWWEKGYNFALRGKGLQKITYAEMAGDRNYSQDSFKEPTSKERWLRANP